MAFFIPCTEETQNQQHGLLHNSLQWEYACMNSFEIFSFGFFRGAEKEVVFSLGGLFVLLVGC